MSSTFHKYAVYIPGVNIFMSKTADTLGFDDIEKILNTLALVAALILNVSFSMLGMVDYESLTAADTRYDENEYFAWFVDGFASYGMVGKHPSAIFIKWCSISNHLMLFVLFSVIIMYIYFIVAIDQGTPLEQVQCRIWWNEGGAILLLGLISVFFTALTFCFYGFGCIGWIKFPDDVAYEEEYERTPSDATRWKSVLNSNTAMAVYGMTWPFIITTLLTSCMYANITVKSRKIEAESVIQPDKILKLMKDKEAWEEILKIAKKDSNVSISAKAAEHMLEKLDHLISDEISKISLDSLGCGEEQSDQIEMAVPVESSSAI
jgi:hypothetical protein